jgi:hypothetical protein
VVRLIDQLDRVAQACPEFPALAGQLTARYPCICSPEMEEVAEEEWAWSDGPLDGDSETAVYGIGINHDRTDEVVPFVISTARALGLNVLDEQRGICFMKDGTVIRMQAGG